MKINKALQSDVQYAIKCEFFAWNIVGVLAIENELAVEFD